MRGTYLRDNGLRRFVFILFASLFFIFEFGFSVKLGMNYNYRETNLEYPRDLRRNLQHGIALY